MPTHRLTGAARGPVFTRSETGVVAILAAGLIAGTLLRMTGVTGGAPADVPPAFDYAASDSMFRALADTARTEGSPRATRRKAPPPASPVDLNTATSADLLRLPGIGSATAARIIDARTHGGPFTRVEDMLRVKGIGPKKLAALRPYVTVR